MLTLSIVLFAIAAIGGIALAGLRLTNKNLPAPLAVAHGVIAAVGLVALAIAVVGGLSGTIAIVSLVLFVIAALGGFVLVSFHVGGKVLPIPLMGVHGLVAVAAFLCLLVSAVV